MREHRLRALMPVWVHSNQARHTLAFGFFEAPLYPYSDFLTSAEASLSWLRYFRGRVTYHFKLQGPETGLPFKPQACLTLPGMRLQ